MFQGKKSKTNFGYVLIIIGVVVLLEKVFNLSLFSALIWGYIWPLLVILLGLYLVGDKK